MRKIQKIIIIFYSSLVAFACIYVPWAVDSNSGYRFQFLGFSFIWQPIVYMHYDWNLKLVPISFIWQPIVYMHYDWNLKLVPILGITIIYIKGLILELIAITVVFAVLFALTLKPKKEQIEK